MPPQPASPLSKPRVLIGEGKDEVNFFEALTAALNLTDVQVEEYGGKAGLPKYLKEFLVRPGRQNVVALGITRDADNGMAHAYQSVCGSVQAAQLPVPAAAGQVQAGPPRVTVFILPDNQRDGMLEDLCLDAVRADGAIPCVTAFFQCVAQHAMRQPKNMAKARVHAWLASQAVPDYRLGEAAKNGYWDWSSKTFDALKQFLQNL